MGTRSAEHREEKGQEKGGLRTYFEALVIYVHFHAPESLTESILLSDDRSRSHASPSRFRVEAVAQHHDLASTVQTHWHDDAVAVECI